MAGGTFAASAIGSSALAALSASGLPASLASLISASSWVATLTAIAAGHLLEMPGTPIGHTSRATAAGLNPSRSSRDRNRAALLLEPMTPSQA